MKRRAVLDEIARVHATGRPILVGTVSVEESESLADDLHADGTGCRVLNAKNDAEEAEIVAEAGAVGAVTISTNMAGRGTDIRLGGSDESERDAVVALGGLYVIGTNRHESRRIDQQLRGRAGRQGDPGASRFFVSLEDDLMRRYRIETLIPKRLHGVLAPDGTVDHPKVKEEVDRVQRIVEGEHGDIRKRLLAYSSVLETQRAEVQSWRQDVVEGLDEGGLLARRCAPRWHALSEKHGESMLRGIERRITLHAIDRCWSDYLADLQAVRDEVHLVTLNGRDPLAEFHRTAGAAFEMLLERIDETIVAIFERVEITASGVDWDREGLLGPSSTWTYLVHDNVFGNNAFHTLSTRPGIAAIGVLLWWPLLLGWGVALRWRAWRKRVRERGR